jgi:hypothetical protein
MIRIPIDYRLTLDDLAALDSEHPSAESREHYERVVTAITRGQQRKLVIYVDSAREVAERLGHREHGS